MKRILVGLDGSSLAEMALPLAEELVQASKGSLLLVRAAPVDEGFETFDNLNESTLRVVPPRSVGDPTNVDTALHEASDYLTAIAQPLLGRGITAEIAAVLGDAPDVLVQEARRHHADLIVLATHGRSGFGRWLYGSVADSILQTSPIPVLLVQPMMTHRHLKNSAKRLRLLVPLDGTPLAESILPVASDLALALDAELYLVRIVPSSPASLTGEKVSFSASHPDRQLDRWEIAARFELEVIAHRLSSQGISVKTTVGNDYPPAGIVAAADDCDASLIVMATHGRHGFERALLGSVALDVLRRSSRPVLLVRPTGAASKTEAKGAVAHPA